MEHSSNLTLPYIMPSQAQKHVTHNEAIRALDALVQLGVLDRDLALPPEDPQEGDRYIVAEDAADEWSDRSGEVAAWQDGAWAFLAPRSGWLAWVADEERLVVHDGSAWKPVGAETTGVSTLGVNATPDETNRLAVASDASLFTHDGSDHRLIVNKASAGDFASIVFQTDSEGRAEIGLAGDDSFRFKVSNDGETFRTAIVIDENTGAASFPATPCGMVNLLINGSFSFNQRGFAGGMLVAGLYGYDRWKAGAGGCHVAASAGVITHTSGPLVQVVESPDLAGRVVTLSVEDLAGGNLAVDIEGQTGVIEPGAGRRGVTLTVPGLSTGNISVRLTPVSGAVTYRRAQLNEGAEAMPFERRHPAQELALCQRYFEKTYGVATVPGTSVNNGRLAAMAPVSGSGATARTLSGMTWAFAVRKRGLPSITVYSPATGAVGHVRDITANADMPAQAGATGEGSAYVVVSSGSIVTATNLYVAHATSEAEL